MSESLPDWPLFGLADDVRPALAQALATGEPAALVTLFAVEGGGPRPPGTQMVFGKGVVSGFLSGGCVEGDVAGHAAATLADGQPRRLVYGEGGPWPDIRLLCGARIELLVERVAPDDPAAAALLAAMTERRPAVWHSDGVTRACEPGRQGRVIEISQAPFGIARRHDPVQRLLVIGSDPTALAISQLGSLSGMETTLLRPKGPANPPPITGVAYRRDTPAEAIAAIGADAWTAVAIATHDSDTDHEALVAALPSAAGYVGLLGARRRLPDRVMRLKAEGLDEAVIGRMHAPIGLPIGGKAPWEVAVAVIGQIAADRLAKANVGSEPL